jgi:hypothetical protein
LGAKTSLAPAVEWAAGALPPSAWAVTLLANYVLVSQACTARLPFILQVLSLAMLALVGGAGVIAWRSLRDTAHPSPEEQGERIERRRFAAHLSLLSCGLFAAAIAAQAVAPWMFNDCTR